MISDSLVVVPSGNNTLIKATSFYDNEMGYSHRMVELALIMMNQN
jgi:glyceraldehyde-3-phosphate dehydrogenase/erythrose-4-phosphate dehydrogenase